jgi:isoquinoline 1-oxidoreductase beta subunit
MGQLAGWTRRDVLLAAGLGGLCIGLRGSHSGVADRSVVTYELTGWVRIAPDDTVTLRSNASEMGQGAPSALAQILADELDVEWSAVRVEMAPIATEFFNPLTRAFMTGGSTAVAGMFGPLTQAGATARALLTTAAAGRWSVAATDCRTERGRVIHTPTGRELRYGEVAAAAGALPLPPTVTPKPRTARQLIGQPLRRLDIGGKVNGSAVFGIDAATSDGAPAALVAAIRHCPVFGGTLERLDATAVTRRPGVRAVVRLGDAVAVVAKDFWTAKTALDALHPEWRAGPMATVSSVQIAAKLREATFEDGRTTLGAGQDLQRLTAATNLAFAQAARVVERTYELPLLAHATLEPMNATAWVTSERAVLWVPTQTQSALRRALAKALGLAEAAVVIHTTLLGGGFGRRQHNDFGVEAALISREVGAPVKLIWSREEDLQHDHYRPAATIRLRAPLSARRDILALRVNVGCLDTDDPTGGLVPSLYAIPNYWVSYAGDNPGVPLGPWRSVDHSQNVFALESFMDELASELGLSGLALRRKLVAPQSRARGVLDAVVELAGAPVAGRSRGLAVAERSGSYVAEIAEISLGSDGRVKVHHVFAVIDCGLVVNPSTVEAQMQGGILFGLSTAALSAITLEAGHVVQGNFDSFPLLTMAQAPEVIVRILDRRELPPSGVGEPPVPPIAPALCNAIAAAGRRCRELPLSRQGLLLA